MNDKQKAIFSLVLLSVLFGSTASLIKIGLVSIPPLSFAFIRFLIAGLIILPFILKKETIKSMRDLLPLSLLGTLNIIFFVLGLKNTTATIAQLLYAAVPLLSGLILYFLYKDQLSPRKILGISLGFLGVLLVILLPLIEKGTKFSGDLGGNLLVVCAVISWSFYIVLSKKKLKSFSPFTITSTFIWATCLALLPLSVLESIASPNWWNHLTVSSVFSLFYVGIVSTVISYLLNQYAIKHGGTIFASMQFYLIPIFAFISAFFLLGELLTVGLAIGAILVLSGIYLVTKK